MATNDKTVKVTLVAVATPYAKGMNEAATATNKLGREIDGTGQKVGKASGALKGMAVAGAAVAGTALVAFLQDAVTAVGDLEQSVGGVNAGQIGPPFSAHRADRRPLSGHHRVQQRSLAPRNVLCPLLQGL